MKTPRLILALVPLAICFPSFAQQAASCDGTWKYTHVDKARGWPAEVEVKITGDKGIYFARLGPRHHARSSPCRDRELPVSVKRCTATELVFKVQGGEVEQGCPTFTARFRITGPDSAEGTIGGRDEAVQVQREH